MEKAKGRQVGLIAQEVEKVLPEVIRQQKDGFLHISYDNLAAVFVEALKDLQHTHSQRLQSMYEEMYQLNSLLNRGLRKLKRLRARARKLLKAANNKK